MFSGNNPKSLQACLQLYGTFKLIAYFQSQDYCVIDKDSEKGELAAKSLFSFLSSSGPAWH
ncbi:MAG TPA: hypothetical protein DCR17_06300 [Verrucomicrobiales bacterium]|nr:hypothetical protein [Pedosphaera sp.]HAO66278.1 hypothetical protein [Verrucomicrobiales bacterium]HAQ99406.1 hypothetical protein [Verrucomicrobiales bacterium]HBP56377.1 hypothetical protein [Verrucomicrobiales bacterium]HCP36403.1 hypothetical protein [Verrucomicrobiales bacterium]